MGWTLKEMNFLNVYILNENPVLDSILKKLKIQRFREYQIIEKLFLKISFQIENKNWRVTQKLLRLVVPVPIAT